MPRCQLIGPITGLPDGNLSGFTQAKQALELHGWSVWSPRHQPLSADCAEESEQLIAAGLDFHEGPLYHQMMRECFEHLLSLTGPRDRALCLPGWVRSHGARREVLFCQTIGVEVRRFEPLGDNEYTLSQLGHGVSAELGPQRLTRVTA